MLVILVEQHVLMVPMIDNHLEEHREVINKFLVMMEHKLHVIHMLLVLHFYLKMVELNNLVVHTKDLSILVAHLYKCMHCSLLRRKYLLFDYPVYLDRSLKILMDCMVRGLMNLSKLMMDLRVLEIYKKELMLVQK